MRIRNRGLILLLFIVLLISIPTSAQEEQEGSARLSSPNTGSFPLIEAHLHVQDSLGGFVHGLRTTDVRILEDDFPITPNTLTHIHTGVQFVTALNPGRSFALRNGQGISRYDFLIGALSDWAQRRSGSTIDDLSLMVTDGLQVSHVADPNGWLAALNRVDTETARDQAPNIDILSQAIDLASDITPRPGMGRAILFVTPPLEGEYGLPLQDLTSRANQQDVHIYVWMVSSEGAYPQQAAEQLMTLAEQTGGEFYIYTGENPIPDVENYLEPSRNTYQLEYNSKIKQSGEHQVMADVITPFGSITSNVQNFEIVVQPPDPAFIAPPLEIIRELPSEDGKPAKDDLPIQDYSPTEQEIQVLVSFPDERVRPLARTTLYVDGEVMDENTAPPFESLTWNLQDYSSSNSHLLQVEAEDTLGLVGTSMETLVHVSIEVPERSPWSWIYNNIPILSGLAVFLAGAVLLLVLILGGRLQPRVLGRLRRSRRKVDPVTQPVQVADEPAVRRLPKWVNRLHWSQRSEDTKTLAFLSRVSESDTASTATPIPLTADKTILGSDPTESTLVLNDPSVEAVHAQLIRKPDGSFRLADKGSVAGTWINYTPVSQEGTKLEHGDLVHVGQVGFRFTLRKPASVRKPVVTIKEPGEDA
jgi:hypothetical protein